MRSALQLIFMLAMVAQSFAADSVIAFDEFSRSLKSEVDKPFPMGAVLTVVAAIILAIIIIVIYEIHRSNKIKKELQSLALEKFNSQVEALKLPEQMLNILKDIINNSNLQDPNTILKSPHVFESGVELYYQNKNIESIPDDTLEQIRELRKRLEFLPMPKDMALTSTRQFNIGSKCLVQVPAFLAKNAAPTHKGMCSITDVGERHWSISKPEGAEIKAQTQMFISLNRPGEAEYKLTADVIKNEDNNLILSHTNKLSRAQLRNWVRVEVDIPVEINQMDGGKIGDIFYGKIIDMSGGGLGLKVEAEFPNNSKLLLNFDLPGQGRVKDLPVKIVRVSGKIHSVAFDGEFYQIQEQIIQYIFEKQRLDALEK